MHTNQISASCAHPAGVFISDELTDSKFLYLRQIIHHTHAIFCSISLIKVFQSRTREGGAGVITVFPFSFVAESQSAFLAAFGVGSQASVTFVLVANISNTKPTVHPTWSYIRYLGERCHGIKY